MSALPDPLVDVKWLSEHIDDDRLVILDASVPPVVPGYVSVNEDGNLRVIPGALRFDYDRQICAPNTSLPHMMPDAELFEDEVRKLGIDRNSRIVVYDDVGLYASPRAWWMFRAMGHDAVAVLDGGLPAWLEAGQTVDDRYDRELSPGDFSAEPVPEMFCDFERVLTAIEDDTIAILDARSAGRFFGRDPEPRPNTRSGHMPTAKNLPFPDVLNGHYLKPASVLREILAPLCAPDDCIITSCGSGITACILTLAAWHAGYHDLQVYDGSWAEWGLPSKLPVV